MPNKQIVEKAKFYLGETGGTPIEVHFNPQSLQYTISNTLDNKGKNDKKKQFISQTSGKLTLDLIFDTTDIGTDVRTETDKIAKLMQPKSDKTPPKVRFVWGSYTFIGMMESFKETIDFFSSEGVPLRASISLTMAAQDKVFERGSKQNPKTSGSPDFPSDSLPASALPGKGATDLATQGGNPEAARMLGEANNLENLRFPGSASIEISESFPLSPPSAFSKGTSGVHISGGLNISTQGSIGSNLSAGISASAGAFSGLRNQSKKSASRFKLNAENFFDHEITANLGVEDPESLNPGGKIGLQGSASMKANMGKSGDLNSRLQFEDS